MVRSKLCIKLIDDKRRRSATFAKRRAGLKKKAMELSLLCDVPILLVCFGPEGQVDVWPEDRGQAHAIIDRFQSASAEDRCKRKCDVSTFFGGAVMKQATELGGSAGEEEEEERGDPQYCSVERLLDLVPESSLEELEWALEARLRAIDERMGALIRREGSLHGGGEQAGAVEGWQQPEQQGLLQFYGLMETTPPPPPPSPGEEIFVEVTGGYWGNPGGVLDEDPAAFLSGLHQNLMHPLTHSEAAVPPPPPPYYSTSFAALCFQPYGADMGTASYLGAPMSCSPHPYAAALAGYPYHPDGHNVLPCLDAPKTGASAPATPAALMPPRPGSAFLDYNAACSSALCAMKFCSSRRPVITSGDAVSLGRAGLYGGGGTREAVASSSSSNGEGVHHRQGELYGVGLRFPQDNPVEEGLENPWGSSIYPAHPSGAIAAAPLPADCCWAGFPGTF